MSAALTANLPLTACGAAAYICLSVQAKKFPTNPDIPTLPLIYGRSIRHLIVVWVVTVASLALLHYIEVSAPAFHELLIPFYWITLGIAVFLTSRWLRSRSVTDRRRSDRRRAARRGDHESSQAADPDLTESE